MTDFVFKPSGEPSQGWTNKLVKFGWEDKAVFKHRKYLEFFFSTSYNLQDEELWEYVVEGGSILAAVDDDQHVGPCLSVRWALAQEPGVLTNGYRKLFKLAKQLGVGWVCYTKETAPFTYTMRYKKV